MLWYEIISKNSNGLILRNTYHLLGFTMKRRGFIFFVFFVFFFLSVFPLQAKDDFPGERKSRFDALSSIRLKKDANGYYGVHVLNRRFSWFYHERARFPHLVLRETFERHAGESISEEMETQEIGVEAFLPEESQRSKPVFWFSAMGEKGEPLETMDPLYKIIQPGACENRNSDLYFSLQTGNALFSSTACMAHISIPNTDVRRIVSFHDNTSYWVPKESENNPNILGVLQYGDSNFPAERFVFSFKEEKVCNIQNIHFVIQGKPWTRALKFGRMGGAPEIENSYDNELELWTSNKNGDPRNVTGFFIVLELELCDFQDRENTRDYKIEIPVIEDRLAVEKTDCPPGITIRRSSLPKGSPLTVLRH